ncbi:MAG: hypothetical protein PHZ13_01935 [bacterium]|nr:hypothetical protein [bacterium]MDD3967427.1 hypothetical protein [Proteiniphilum sp.]MDD4458551.1 hypothetical protein [Proteiniphilum sp.]
MKRARNLHFFLECDIIAADDQASGNLEKVFPREVRNFHFDAVINDDVLAFDYQLQQGITE